MGIVHPDAQLSPAKIEIIQDWFGKQDWFDADPATLETRRRFGYRFDDPAGEVGVESVLATAGDRTYQFPMTYRSAELPGADDYFLTNMEHTVLGRRWAYLGLGDPVFVQAFASAATTGATSVDVEFTHDGRQVVIPTLVQAKGTGGGTAPSDIVIGAVDVSGPVGSVTTSAGVLSLPFELGAAASADGPRLVAEGEGYDGTLLATWSPRD